jgi:hypothetical protein
MKILYSKPAPGETYLISKKDAKKLISESFPELEILSFKTRKGPNMSKDILYLATLSQRELQILSVKLNSFSEPLALIFRNTILPYICKKIEWYVESSYNWKTVIVMIDSKIYETSCSTGCLFPNKEEIIKAIKKSSKEICELK